MITDTTLIPTGNRSVGTSLSALLIAARHEYKLLLKQHPNDSNGLVQAILQRAMDYGALNKSDLKFVNAFIKEVRAIPASKGGKQKADLRYSQMLADRQCTETGCALAELLNFLIQTGNAPRTAGAVSKGDGTPGLLFAANTGDQISAIVMGLALGAVAGGLGGALVGGFVGAALGACADESSGSDDE